MESYVLLGLLVGMFGIRKVKKRMIERHWKNEMLMLGRRIALGSSRQLEQERDSQIRW